MDEKAADAGAGSEKAAPGMFYLRNRDAADRAVPGGATIEHFRNSRIEFLKGVRSLIDERIAQLSRQTEHKGTHVTVE